MNNLRRLIGLKLVLNLLHKHYGCRWLMVLDTTDQSSVSVRVLN